MEHGGKIKLLGLDQMMKIHFSPPCEQDTAFARNLTSCELPSEAARHNTPGGGGPSTRLLGIQQFSPHGPTDSLGSDVKRLDIDAGLRLLTGKLGQRAH
jgi:hypothetical protein